MDILQTTGRLTENTAYIFPQHKFLKHVEYRWLSLKSAVDRIIG